MKFVFSLFKNKRNIKKQAGFTLVELMVVFMIMTIILSASVANYSRFGKSIELENDAYNLALTIREAQVYGVNKKTRDSNEIEFGESYSYGVYFNKTSNIYGVDNETFLIYIDGLKDNGTVDNKFTSVGTNNCTGIGNDECYSWVNLQKKNRVKSIYVKDSNNIWQSVDGLDVHFERPIPDAIIQSSDSLYNNTYGGARVVIEDQTGEFSRCVEIGVTGSISIKVNCE